MIGYDLDGTLTNPFNWNKYGNKGFIGFLIGNIRRLPIGCKYRPKEKYFYIITGRPRADYCFTLLWLWLNKIRPTKVFFVNKLHDLIKYDWKKTAIRKAQVILREGVHLYYEDEKLIREYLKELCPEITIVNAENLNNTSR